MLPRITDKSYVGFCHYSVQPCRPTQSFMQLFYQHQSSAATPYHSHQGLHLPALTIILVEVQYLFVSIILHVLPVQCCVSVILSQQEELKDRRQRSLSLHLLDNRQLYIWVSFTELAFQSPAQCQGCSLLLISQGT